MRHLALVAILAVLPAVAALPWSERRPGRRDQPVPNATIRSRLLAFGRSAGAEIVPQDARLGHAVLATGDSRLQY